MDDVDLTKILDENLRDFVKMNSYIKCNDPYFTIKIKYGMMKKRFNKNLLAKNEIIDTFV